MSERQRAKQRHGVGTRMTRHSVGEVSEQHTKHSGLPLGDLTKHA